MVLTTALRRAAKVNGGGVAIADDDKSVTWKELCGRVARIAGALRAMGVQPGDRVAILSLNRPEVLEVQYAILWAGALLVPLNYRFAVVELRHALEMSGAKVLLADLFLQEAVRDVRGQIDGLNVLWLAASPHAGDVSYMSLLSGSPIDDRGVDRLSDVAGIFFTGGTTGLPKGVALTHQNLLVHLLEMSGALTYASDSIYAHIMPMFHLGGFGTGHALTLAAGTHCFLNQFSAQRCLALIASRRVTHLSLVPTMLAMLLDEVELPNGASAGVSEGLSNVKTITYGAAPISGALLARLVQRFPRAKLRQFYGMTETCGACVTLAPEFHGPEADNQRRMKSVGRPMATADVKVIRSDGSECLPNESGEILFRGPQVMSGYWNDPEGTARALKDGWMHTGDVGAIDDEGFISLHDRSKDMIISGGENIFSVEVENVLASHDQVVECAVIGLPDQRWGERVHAVVVVRPGAGLDGLAVEFERYCRDKIAGYKIPRSWTISATPLPLSGVGKVQKQKIRQEILRDDHG